MKRHPPTSLEEQEIPPPVSDEEEKMRCQEVAMKRHPSLCSKEVDGILSMTKTANLPIRQKREDVKRLNLANEHNLGVCASWVSFCVCYWSPEPANDQNAARKEIRDSADAKLRLSGTIQRPGDARGLF